MFLLVQGHSIFATVTANVGELVAHRSSTSSTWQTAVHRRFDADFIERRIFI